MYMYRMGRARIIAYCRYTILNATKHSLVYKVFFLDAIHQWDSYVRWHKLCNRHLIHTGFKVPQASVITSLCSGGIYKK